jgi:hypothetical protein
VAAPVFREVATTALRIFDVPKDLPDTSSLVTENRAPKTSSNDDRDAAVGNDLAIAGLGEAPEVWESTGSTQDSAHGGPSASGAARTRAVSSVTQPPVHPDAKVSAEASQVDRRPFLTASAEPQAAPAPWGTREGGTRRAPAPPFGGTKVPDFRGLPLSSVLAEAAAAGLQVEVHGSGLARDQEPQPGAYLPARAAIRVQFAK